MNTYIIDEVVEQLKAMSQPLQQQVLEFAQILARTKVRGTPGQQLLSLAGATSADDLQLMQAAIQQDYEQVDIHEW
jgi:DNA-binding protein YbaB